MLIDLFFSQTDLWFLPCGGKVATGIPIGRNCVVAMREKWIVVENARSAGFSAKKLSNPDRLRCLAVFPDPHSIFVIRRDIPMLISLKRLPDGKECRPRWSLTTSFVSHAQVPRENLRCWSFAQALTEPGAFKEPCALSAWLLQ